MMQHQRSSGLSDLITNLFMLVLEQMTASGKKQEPSQLQKSKSFVDHDISMRLLKEIVDSMQGMVGRFLTDVPLFDQQEEFSNDLRVERAKKIISLGDYKSIGDLL